MGSPVVGSKKPYGHVVKFSEISPLPWSNLFGDTVASQPKVLQNNTKPVSEKNG
jgi:hypothetical protein